VGRTLLLAKEHYLKVCVANTTNKSQLLSAGTLLGRPVALSTVEDDRQTLTAATRNTGTAETSFGNHRTGDE